MLQLFSKRHMEKLFLALLAMLALVCQCRQQERTDAKIPSQMSQVVAEYTSSMNCCEYSTVTWEQADSVENALPPLNECAATVREALKNFKIKRTEIRRNEPLREHFGFPENCIFYEYSELKSTPLRAIALVIEKPKFTIDLDDVYSCPSEITGHGFVCGKAYFVLLDPKSRQTLDTCPSIVYQVLAPPACREFPFSICKGYSYQSNGSPEKEGLAQILAFQDFDRDGLATEFPIFEHGACGFKLTAIIGYNPKADKIQPLVFNFKVTEEDWRGARNGRDSTYQSFHNWMPTCRFLPFMKKTPCIILLSLGTAWKPEKFSKYGITPKQVNLTGKYTLPQKKTCLRKAGHFLEQAGFDRATRLR